MCRVKSVRVAKLDGLGRSRRQAETAGLNEVFSTVQACRYQRLNHQASTHSAGFPRMLDPLSYLLPAVWN